MRTRMILPATLLLGAMSFAAQAREATTITGRYVDKIVTPGAGRGADVTAVLTIGRDVHPDGTAGQASWVLVSRRRQIFSGQVWNWLKGVELEPLINDSGKHKLLLSVGRFFSSWPLTARVSANDLSGRGRLRPPALQVHLRRKGIPGRSTLRDF